MTLKKMIAIGDINDLFLYYLRIVNQYNKDEIIIYYLDKNHSLNANFYRMFLGMQNVKFQLLNLNREDFLEFNKNYEIILDDKNQNNDTIEIKNIEINLYTATNIVQEFLNKRIPYIVIQLSEFIDHQSQIIWDADTLNYFKKIPNVAFVGKDNNFDHKNNFTYLNLIDQLHIIKNSKLFIGQSGIYSHYAGSLGKEQILYQPNKKLCFFNWQNLLNCTKTIEDFKTQIEKYVR